MRLTTPVLGLLILAPAAPAQIWEKSLAPGMTYRFEFEPMLPRIVHSLRIVPTAPGLRAVPALPKKVVYASDPAKGRGTVSEMVRNAAAMGGVNGDFFPWTGDPLGLMVQGGQLLSLPNQRSAFAWGPGGSAIVQPKFQGVVISPTTEIPFAGWNEDPGQNRASVFTPAGGLAVCKGPSLHLVFETSEAEFRPASEFIATLKNVLSDAGDLAVAPGTVVVAAQGSAMEAWKSLKPGDAVTFRTKFEGMDVAQLDQAVAGGPTLLRDGKVAVDAETQGFNDGFTKTRHPRTAVGRTAEGDLVFVVVDGRQPMSVGASLEELASIMRRLQCVDAVNLDGGGSSSIFLRGITLNRPSAGSERAVANGVVFFAPEPPVGTAELKVAGVKPLPVGTSLQLTLKNPDGSDVPHAEVLWSAQGAGWIDQGGLLRGFRDGVAEVAAYCRGKVWRASITVGKGSPPPKPPARKPPLQ